MLSYDCFAHVCLNITCPQMSIALPNNINFRILIPVHKARPRRSDCVPNVVRRPNIGIHPYTQNQNYLAKCIQSANA